MSWALDNVLLVTAVMIVVGIAAALLAFITIVKKFGHYGGAAASGGSAVVSLVIAVLFTVGINQLWAARRGRDAHALARRMEHFHRLQLVLREEGKRLQSWVAPIQSAGYLKSGGQISREQVWADDVLSPDVERHFPDYFRARESFLTAIVQHDTEYASLSKALRDEFLLPAPVDSHREHMAPYVISRCTISPAGQIDWQP